MSPERATESDREPVSDGHYPSARSLQALLDSVPALLWETDSELRITGLAGASLRAIAVSPEQFTGRPIGDLFWPSGCPEKAHHAHEIALGGETSSFELHLKGRDLQAKLKPLRGPGEQIIGVIGIAVDMTERMFAERALRLSEHGYRSLIEEAPYAICRSTISGELLQVNRAMAEMLGYDAASSVELLLRDLPLIFTPPGSFEAFQKALLDGGSHPGTDGAWLTRSGQTIHVRVSGRVVRNLADEISHLDVFAENVTEKKQLELELSHAQRIQAIGQLAGGVAHDFNNLLTVISGHVEIMLSEPGDAASRDRLGEVKQAAEKAASLTQQLLAFSRRQVLRSRTINLNEVIGKFTGMLARLIKENVELIFVPGDNLGSVKADPNEIERVLLNLALNAQDAMPRGGRLKIETANVHIQDAGGRQPDELKPGHYVQILVSDTGIGMEPGIQARVFEPFFTTKQLNGGTGLGLSVVFGVVRQSGGYIRLESEPGVGTIFRIYLPRLAGTVAAPRRETSRLASLPRGSETILFAEDDEAIRTLVVRALEKLGYRVLSAPDGVEAIALSQSYTGEIHMLLSDLVMPVVGGRELADRLKGADPDLKVVFISGYAGHDAADSELDVAGASFLRKPFSMDSLANTVRRVLDGYAS